MPRQARAQREAATPSSSSWRVAPAPASYGAVDDERLCRHVRVPRGIALVELKRMILKAFEDQYTPDQITLFTRIYCDDPKRVTTDRQVGRALSYAPDWEDLRHDPEHDPNDEEGSVLIVVSAMNPEEDELLFVPAAHSIPQPMLVDALRPPAPAPAALTAALPMLEKLATASTSQGIFRDLPLPAHIDDWQAQFREATQSVSELLSSQRAQPSGEQRTICIQPLQLEGGGAASGGRGGTDEAAALFEGIVGFMTAFFHGTPVRLLPPIRAQLDERSRAAQVLGRRVAWRDHCPGNDKAQPQGQWSAPDLLAALKPKLLRGKKGAGRRAYAGGALPPDGFCVLGVTLGDLYTDDDDEFTGGLACLQSRAGVFSFHRYAHQERSVAVARAAKTAAHEALHMYGIGHCMHRACLMNGSGHLLEDFAAPLHLCPVDLAKLLAALGPSCQVLPRYGALLAFCEAHRPGFQSHATWLRQAISFLEPSFCIPCSGSPRQQGGLSDTKESSHERTQVVSGGTRAKDKGSKRTRMQRTVAEEGLSNTDKGPPEVLNLVGKEEVVDLVDADEDCADEGREDDDEPAPLRMRLMKRLNR